MATVKIELKGGLVQTPVVDPSNEFRLTNWWRTFFSSLTRDFQAATSVVMRTQTYPGLTAALPLTPLPSGSLAAGMYRVTVYLQILTAASVTSSVTPVVTYTDTVVCTQTATAVTSNDPTLPGGSSFMVRVDSGTPISLSTVYASNAAGMTYDVVVVLEQIGVTR